jgi:type VI secretion system secreted protein VgrG
MPQTEPASNVAPFQFSVGRLGPGAFGVTAFTGREAISQPFRFEIDLVSPDPDLSTDDVLGQAATLARQRGADSVLVHGVVASFDVGAQTPDRSEYRVVLVPRLWRLGMARQSRVFQNVSVPEVVASVLAEHGLARAAVRTELSAEYPTSEFVVQYQESDLAFVSRLLEREGAWFTFEHDEADVLVISDRREAFPPIEPGPGGDDDVAFRPGSGMVRDRGEAVDRVGVRDRLVPGRVVLRDYNYRTPETDLEVAAPIDGGGAEEVYAYGDHYKSPAEGDRLARVRADEVACRRRVVTGAGDVAGFRAGSVFRLSGHPRADLDGDLLLTAVEHRGVVAPDAGGDGAPQTPRYENTFEAIPAAAPFRPARVTPVPRAPGLMTARVESAGGPYAFVDEEGRYRARLALDRSGIPEAQASRPVRMAQPYSGPDYGLHLPNHAGTEMVLGFANGDVDRPLALGTVPNPAQGSPAVAQNRMENVLRSWAGNALVLDDTRQGEHVHLTAVKDHTETVADRQQVDVGSTQTITVGADRSKRVEGDQSESVGGDKTIDVEGSHAEQVTGDVSVRIGGTETVDVAESSEVRVTEARSLSVGAEQETTVGDRFALQIGAGATVTVSDEATGRVGERLDVRAGTEVRVEAADRIALVCGQSRIVLSSDGTVTIEGSAVSVNGSSRIAMKAPSIKEN